MDCTNNTRTDVGPWETFCSIFCSNFELGKKMCSQSTQEVLMSICAIDFTFIMTQSTYSVLYLACYQISHYCVASTPAPGIVTKVKVAINFQFNKDWVSDKVSLKHNGCCIYLYIYSQYQEQSKRESACIEPVCCPILPVCCAGSSQPVRLSSVYCLDLTAFICRRQGSTFKTWTCQLLSGVVPGNKPPGCLPGIEMWMLHIQTSILDTAFAVGPFITGLFKCLYHF